MSETNFERRWRTILWLMIGVVFVLLLATIWDYVRWRRGQDGDGVEWRRGQDGDGVEWRRGQDGDGVEWRRGSEVRKDTDGDGRIDEVRYESKHVTNEFLVKRDTNGDGKLNMRYILRDGIAVEITYINEAVEKP